MRCGWTLQQNAMRNDNKLSDAIYHYPYNKIPRRVEMYQGDSTLTAQYDAIRFSLSLSLDNTNH